MKTEKPMRGVIWRNGGWWFSKTTNGSRVWVNLDTRVAAEAVARALAIRTSPLVDTRESLAGCAERFIRYKRSRGVFTERSEEKARFVLTSFAAQCGEHATIR